MPALPNGVVRKKESEKVLVILTAPSLPPPPKEKIECRCHKKKASKHQRFPFRCCCRRPSPLLRFLPLPSHSSPSFLLLFQSLSSLFALVRTHAGTCDTSHAHSRHATLNTAKNKKRKERRKRKESTTTTRDTLTLLKGTQIHLHF